jgi:hypothetical protein
MHMQELFSLPPRPDWLTGLTICASSSSSETKMAGTLNWPHLRLVPMSKMRGGNFAMSSVQFHGMVLKHGGKIAFTVE